MSETLPWTTLLGLVGAAQGLLLAGAAVSLGGRSNRPNIALAAVLVLLSAAVGVITAEHAGLFGPPIFLVLAEISVSLAFPPALWHYADTVLGGRGRVPVSVHWIPAGAWLTYLVVMVLRWSLGGRPTACGFRRSPSSWPIWPPTRSWSGSGPGAAPLAHGRSSLTGGCCD